MAVEACCPSLSGCGDGAEFNGEYALKEPSGRPGDRFWICNPSSSSRPTSSLVDTVPSFLPGEKLLISYWLRTSDRFLLSYCGVLAGEKLLSCCGDGPPLGCSVGGGDGRPAPGRYALKLGEGLRFVGDGAWLL
jgi:hypothetical protein